MTEFMNKLGNLMIIAVVFLACFVMNVYLHELGHYVVADSFGLSPKIEMASFESLSFSFSDVPLAVTEFKQPSSDAEMAFIAVAGPIVNLLLCLIFLTVFLAVRDKKYKVLMSAAFIPSLVSFLSNILPLGMTDGSILLRILIG